MTDDAEIIERMAKASEAFGLVDSIINRALLVVADAPYFKYVEQESRQFATVGTSDDGQMAILAWPTAESDWDLSMLAANTISFPSRLLVLTDDELSEWKKDERRKYEVREADNRQKAIEQSEEKERAEYYRLRLKFERT